MQNKIKTLKRDEMKTVHGGGLFGALLLLVSCDSCKPDPKTETKPAGNNRSLCPDPTGDKGDLIQCSKLTTGTSNYAGDGGCIPYP